MHGGQPVLSAQPKPGVKIAIDRAVYGPANDPRRTRDVRDRVQRKIEDGETSFPALAMAEGDDPAPGVVKTLELEYTRDGQQFSARGTDPDVIDLRPPASGTSERIAELHGTLAGRASLLAFQPGRYALRTAGGQRREVEISSALAPIQIDGPWTVRFAPGWGAPAESRFETLLSWSAHPDAGVRYFSGAATYAKNFTVRRELLSRKARLYLDLGRVEVMANVTLNGEALGLLWKAPFRVDITDAAKAGENHLEITVVNLWPNRLIGDEQLAEDSERNPDGTLKRWPEWLLQGKPSPTGRRTFTSWRLWKKDDPLLDSGLLGPVQLQPAQRVELP